MRFLICACALIILNSCASLKLANDKKDITQLNLGYVLNSNINPILKPYIDSVFDATINQFNSEGRSFIVKRQAEGEESDLTVVVKRAKYIKKSGVTAGYIISGLGLIAAPVTMLASSGGQWFIIFLYLPADRIEMESTLSPSLSAKPGKKVRTIVNSGALFTSKSKRLKKMSGKLDLALYDMLIKLDENKKR